MKKLLSICTLLVIVVGCSKNNGSSYAYSIEGDWKHLKSEVILDNATHDFLNIVQQYTVSFRPDGKMYQDIYFVGNYERTNENTIKVTRTTQRVTWDILTLNDTMMIMKKYVVGPPDSVCAATCQPIKEMTSYLKRL